MLDLYRSRFKGLEKGVGKLFSALPLSPNQYTLSSVLFAFFTLFFLYKQKILIGLIFLAISSFMDFVDGAVARYKHLSTKQGAFIDTIVDRFVEAILLFGILFLPLSKIIFSKEIWIYLILFGSLMTTYVKAAAKEKDLVNEELKGGLLARSDRLILIIFSLIIGLFSFYWMTYILILVAVLSNITALQRISFALKKRT
jgi:phosphatidylglycerophosphate synthase